MCICEKYFSSIFKVLDLKWYIMDAVLKINLIRIMSIQFTFLYLCIKNTFLIY